MTYQYRHLPIIFLEGGGRSHTPKNCVSKNLQKNPKTIQNPYAPCMDVWWFLFPTFGFKFKPSKRRYCEYSILPWSIYTIYLAKWWYFTNLDFPEIFGVPFPFLSTLPFEGNRSCFRSRANLTRYMAPSAAVGCFFFRVHQVSCDIDASDSVSEPEALGEARRLAGVDGGSNGKMYSGEIP